jgi:hypothetical protein
MSSLDQSVTAKIQSGVLPKSVTEARVGRGRGGHCAVCPVVIRPPDPEVEVELESRRGVFHQACFNLWRDVVAGLRAQESWVRSSSPWGVSVRASAPGTGVLLHIVPF